MLAAALPLGLLIGVSLGALGGGGSILTVPALVYVLDQSPHAATSGSLLIVGITAVAGMLAHARAGRVRYLEGSVFGVLGVAGSYVGSRLSSSVSPNVLLTAFAVLMLVAAVGMVRRRLTADGGGEPAAADRSRRAPWHLDLGGVLKVVGAATVVGLTTGFFGVGGGFVIVPALVLVLGFPMSAAVGTSLLVITINSAAALGARLGGGSHLDWPLLGAFTAAAILGSLVGNRIASRVSAARLSGAFAVLLIGVAVYTLARAVPHLA